MRKVLRVVTGILFVSVVWSAYSTTLYVVTYYHQLIPDPDLRSVIFSVPSARVHDGFLHQAAIDRVGRERQNSS